jgi:large subunit ribosomal protein L31e
MERLIVVPLRKARRGSKERFAPKAMKYLKAFIKRHMKAQDVLIGSELNEFIWSRGVHNPPRRVQVKTTRKDGTAYAELATVSLDKWKAFIKTEKTKEEKKKEKERAKEEKKKDEKRAKEEKKKEELKAKEKKKKAKAKKKTKAKPKAKKKEVKKKKLPVKKPSKAEKPVLVSARRKKKAPVKKTAAKTKKKTAAKKTAKK